MAAPAVGGYGRRMANSLMVRDPRGDLSALADLPELIDLRELREQDLDAAGEAYRLSHHGTSSQMTIEEATGDVRAAWQGEYGQWLPGASLGAWRGDELLGAVLTVRDAPWDDVPPGPFIIDLFVIPAARRMGIARALVAAAVRAVPEPVALRVDDTAPAARALYLDLGFREVG